MALGFLEEDGKISLSDSISKYLPEDSATSKSDLVREQTIEDMLQMRTAFPKERQTWFSLRCSDRVRAYFESPDGALYPSGTLFSYDSTASFVLGALVERVSGKTLVEYLDEKLFTRLGIEEVECLKCPGGHSWADSALLMKPMDLLKSAKFLLDGGRINGEQVLNEDFVRKATSSLVASGSYGFNTYDAHGYGYQIWRTHENSFFFNGMGCQIALCCPEKNITLVYNGDNQGIADTAKSLIIDGFFSLIYDEAKDYALAEYSGEPIPEYKLFAIRDKNTSAFSEKINGRRFIAKNNPMGICEFTLKFKGDEGIFTYVNESGEKELPFGICKNVFSLFPEDGYSDEVGSAKAPGHKYTCATSAAWSSDNYLNMRVQIIDKYFGNLGIEFAFKDDVAVVRMTKCAEDFLDEYSGLMVAKMENND
jgi:hypothetical protein